MYGLYDNAQLDFAPGVGMQLIPGDIVSDSIALLGVYDHSLSRIVFRLAKQGGLLVDVGANLGYFSLLWANARPENRVIAFDASPRILPRLAKNVAANAFEDRIDIRAQAVSDHDGEMNFDVGPADQFGWGMLSRSSTSTTVSVPVVRLDEALRDVAEIALLKIDIEGADTLALLGAEGLLRERAIRTIVWEVNEANMATLGISRADFESAMTLLIDCGYVMRRQGDCYFAHLKTKELKSQAE
jgi:FkbM family methyltransferase